MENPTEEIAGVIHQLTQTSPSVQRDTILKYFTNDAAFIHPFCRTGGFDGSRFLIQAIYRWYKIMSPRIQLSVNAVAYDSNKLILYVSIFQIFKIWLIPFYEAPVELTTVLKLKKGSNNKYYIAEQNDLYQVDQFVKFFTWPFGFLFVLAWQFIASLVCLAAAVTCWPISWMEENSQQVRYEANNDAKRVEARLKHTFEGKENGDLITAPAIRQ